nr:TSUP family transporter [Homoserinimonas sp. OAct 916]
MVAATIHRITGMGFALCATPILVLLYGPHDGVLVVTVTAMTASAIMLASRWRTVEWRRAATLVLPGLLIAPLGAIVTWHSPQAVLLLVVGVAAVGALLAASLSPVATTAGRGNAVLVGGAAGFLHITSGLSGPPLVAHAMKSGWPHASFAITVQAIFLPLSASTLLWRGLPEVSGPGLLLACAAVAVGLFAGSVASRRITARTARMGMLVMAWAGAVLVLLRGIWELAL